MKYRKTVIIGLILTILFLVVYPNRGEAFYFNLFDLSTNQVEYYSYETIEIHSNWTYYYSENEVGFVQIQLFNESGMILWASQEYSNRSTYMEVKLNVSLNDLNYAFNKPQDVLELKLFFFYDDGERIISTYQESSQVKIFTSGVYNFSMFIDKESYQYYDTCNLNSSWYLLHNSIYETANVSFQLRDENQNIKWTSDFFNFFGAESCLLSINLSFLDLELNESYNNFSMIAIYSNYNKHLNENSTTIINLIFFPVFSKDDYKIDLYDLSTDNVEYYFFDTLQIHANWTYYYSEDEIGFVQIQILNETGMSIWISQEYSNRSTYMEINLNVSLGDLNYTFNKPQDFLEVKLYAFNDDGVHMVSTYQESLRLKIFTSGIYNFTMHIDKDAYQYYDACNLNSSWYLMYHSIYESANISFQIFDNDQNLKWASNNYSTFGINSISLCINFSLLDLGLNRVINNFTLKVFYAYCNKLIPENNSEIICEFNFQIIVDILKSASLTLSNSSYYFTSVLDISTSWGLEYLPENQDLFIQIIIMDEKDNLIWASQRFNDTGLHIQNWQLSLSELPLNFTKDSEVLEICFNLYWQDLIILETVSENIIKKIIQVVKSNLNWMMDFEDADMELIQLQIQIFERETGDTVKYGDMQLKIFYESSLVFQGNYITDLDGLITINFHKDKELFCGVNHIVLELQSELFNNNICIYDYLIDEDTLLGSSSPLPSIITNPLFYGIICGFLILSFIIIFKFKKKKLASLTISEELLEN